MKIVRKDFVRNGPGSVKVRSIFPNFQTTIQLNSIAKFVTNFSVTQMVPVDSDDLWYAYNLIAPGDSIMAVTIRKVLREAANGGRDAERVKLKLEIKVEDVCTCFFAPT
jgi:protein pelota